MVFTRIDLRRSAEDQEDFARKRLNDWLSKHLQQ